MVLRDLTTEEIEKVLQNQFYAHLGFLDESNSVNVLPITYVYDNNCLYSYSLEGRKIEAMRENPNVCAQIELLETSDAWQSVQVWGTYKELPHGTWSTVAKLVENFWNNVDKNNILYTPMRDFQAQVNSTSIIYALEIERVTGKLGRYAKRTI